VVVLPNVAPSVVGGTVADSKYEVDSEAGGSTVEMAIPELYD